MTVRFCTTCDADVQISDGFCLLGHSVRVEAATTPLDHLQVEVDKAYEEASFRVASVLVEEGETPKGLDAAPTISAAPPPPPPPPRHRPSYEEMWAAFDDDVEGTNDPIAAFAPPPRMDWGPQRHLPFKRRVHAGS